MRATLAATGALAYATTVFVVAFCKLDADIANMIFNGLGELIVLLGVGIGGDTWRPSGQAVSATGAAQALSAQALQGAATDTPPPTPADGAQPVAAVPGGGS